MNLSLVCPDSVLAIGEHSSELGKTLALSLGSPQYCRLFKDAQLAAIKYVDFLFANKSVSSMFEVLESFRVEVKRKKKPGSTHNCQNNQ